MAFAERRGTTWRSRFKLPDGTYGSKPGFATKQDALDYGNAQETDVRRGTFYNPRDGELTVDEWAKTWITTIDVRPSSLSNYKKRLRCQIQPRWGDVALSDITPSAVRAWEKDLRATASKNYADVVIGLFRTMLDDAVVDRKIPENPVKRPNRKRGKYRRPVQVEQLWASPEQVLRLAENARLVWGLAGYAFILTKAYTGMRQGEMYGLRRQDCALLGKPHDHTVQVDWQYQYVDGKPEFIEPKYESRRRLVIPPFLADLLSMVLASHTEDFVFVSPKGSSMLCTDFSTYLWKPIIQGAPERKGRYARPAIPAMDDLIGLVPHGLRHGHKVWLDEDLNARVAVEVRMGHRIGGVEGTYSHVSAAMERRISETLQERWEKSVGNAEATQTG